MLSLLPLLSRRLEDLTNADLSKIASVMKLNVVVTDELRDAGLSLLKGNGIDSVAELVQNPESIQQLLGLLSPPKVEPEEAAHVVRCPHCVKFFIL